VNNLKTAAAAVLVLVLAAFPAAGQTQGTPASEAQVVTASGDGSITAGDVAHAKDDAIEDALRKAVEQTLGTMIQAETLVENSQLIDDRILSKTQGYVQKYQILKEGKVGTELYQVTVQAWIKTADLKSDLDAIATLLQRKNMPRLMVLIEERNIGETADVAHFIEADLNTAETALTDAFMTKGFRFVDVAVVSRNLDRARASAILEGNAAQAAALGRKVGAEVVVSGKALAKATEIEAFGSKIRSQQATVTAKAIRANTGDVIAVATAQGKHAHIDDMTGGTIAIQKACAVLAEDLMNKILAKWQTEVSSGGTITLNVRNVQDYGQLSNFTASLKTALRGVNSVIQRDFDNGQATLEIDMRGSAGDLAQRLTNQGVQGFRLKVVGVTEGSVTISLSEPPAKPAQP